MVSSTSSVSDLTEVLRELQVAGSPRARGGHDFHSHAPGTSNIAGSSPLSSNEGESKSSSVINSAALPPAVVASAQSSRKHRLWKVPDSTDSLCFKLIGQGGVFCITSNCTTNHRGVKFFHPLPGEIYVMKSPETAFVAPIMKADILGDTIWERWSSEANTLEEWNERFDLVHQEHEYPSLRDPSSKISEEDLIATGEQKTSIMKFKTPFKKSKPDSDDVIMRSLVSLPDSITQLQLDDDESPNEFMLSQLQSMGKAIQNVYSNYQLDNEINVQGLRKLELNVNKFSSDLGTKPSNLDEKFNAPSLWLSLALMADQINELQEYNTRITQAVMDISNQFSVDKVEASVERMVAQNSTTLNSQINQLNRFSVEANRTLNNRIKQVEMNASSNPVGNNHQRYLDDFRAHEKATESRLIYLENELSSLRSYHDTDAIKFAQLGFRSSAECSAWIETHHPGSDFGLLIDFHLAMEHVHVQMTGQKLMSNLEKVYKMSLKTNNQALAIASFESRLPRFFSQDQKSNPRKDESYFPGIKSWDEWDLPHDGYRDRLKVELHMLKVGHQETLDNELTHLSPYHNLCVLALTESVAWVDALIRFLDETYNEYSRSRYGPKKAWHITTRLARSLIEKVARPRNSIQNSFKISHPAEVSKSISYATLRALDNMMEITSFNFKNSPIVTAEISKFLALNANHEQVEKMQSTLSSLSTDSELMKKEVKAANAAANTASNKIDTQMKSALEDLKKRIRSLESKK